jgi:protease II
LLFSIFDEAHRAFEIRRLVIGHDCHAQPEIVYTEQDGAYHVHVSKTSSRAFLLISSSSMDTSEVRFAPAGSPDVGFELIQPRQQGVEDQVGHHGEYLLILTNRDARNFKVLEAWLSRSATIVRRALFPAGSPQRITAKKLGTARVRGCLKTLAHGACVISLA